MPRQKKEQYSKVQGRDLYRKMRKDASGKWVALYGHTTQELELKIAQFDAEQAAGLEYRDNPLFEDYAQRWMTLKDAQIGEDARKQYHYTMRKDVLPPMQGRRLRDIRTSDIQAVINDVLARSLYAATKVRSIYKAVFSAALKDNIISIDPCTGLFPVPSRPKKKRRSLDENQVNILMETVRGRRIELFLQIALYTGMRRGEILGLQWDCVDFGNVPAVTVARAIHWRSNQPVCSETLKSPAAHRIIPIPAPLVDALTAAKSVSQSEYVLNTEGRPWTRAMFTSYWKYIVRHSAMPYTYWRRIKGKGVQCMVGPAEPGDPERRIDCHVTPHMLRHTYATRLIGGGADVKTVQYLMGHETVQMTLDIYADLFYNRPEDMLPIVSRIFGK